ncbi:hypothetical protein TanjilG_24824 [Lupinus angustifolius]|uniref:HMA domain-containing protein n=1 Tax=Lupinus angustifolius TaxID=3871 RepID=A0A4P1RKU6_LUPAN|nr:hypothetical protein TanjilG_24824 [Lupinus angustifolius]
MGALDFLSDYFSVSTPKQKRKPMQVFNIVPIPFNCPCVLMTVEIKVKMDCEGCERRVRSSVSNMKAQAYDKKAPSGYVRNIVQTIPNPNATDEKITTLFSDDNPNACSIM